MTKNLFDYIDERIIRILFNAGIPLTIGEISCLTRISWITIKIHIQQLIDKGIVLLFPTATIEKVIFNFQTYGHLA